MIYQRSWIWNRSLHRYNLAKRLYFLLAPAFKTLKPLRTSNDRLRLRDSQSLSIGRTRRFSDQVTDSAKYTRMAPKATIQEARSRTSSLQNRPQVDVIHSYDAPVPSVGLRRMGRSKSSTLLSSSSTLPGCKFRSHQAKGTRKLRSLPSSPLLNSEILPTPVMKNRLHAIGLDLQQSNVSNQKADAKILSLSDEPDNLMQYRQLQSTASADDDGYEELAQQELSAIDLDEDAWSQDVQYMTDGSAEILEAFETSQPRLDNYDLDEIQFKIPQHVFQDASEAPEGSAEHYWNHTMYRGPDGQRPEVLYCDNRETTEQIAKTFLNETVIGLDLEWKYNAMRKHGPRSNVSLIQVASQSRIALFHIGVFVKGANEPTDLIPPSLRKLIESPSITKVGVAINGDCTRLRNHLRLNARGRFELSQLYKLVKYVPTKQFWLINKRLVRLALQSEEHLHLPMFKGSSVRLADWSKQLNSDQIMYAASDPYACLHIYDALQRKRLSLVPPPPCPSHTELGLPIRIFDTPVEICEFPNLSTSLKASFNVQDQEESSDDDDASSCSSSLSSSSEFETLNRHTSPLKAAEPSVKKGSSICGRGSDKPTFRRAVAVNATASRTSVTVIASRPRVSAKIPRVPPHQVVEAESWIAEYCDSLSRPPKASRASLRAYALWHRAGLPIEECARSLREPPLQTSTVATYILEVVRLDQLECDPNRLRDLSTFVPPRLLETRYIGIRRLLDKTGP